MFMAVFATIGTLAAVALTQRIAPCWDQDPAVVCLANEHGPLEAAFLGMALGAALGGTWVSLKRLVRISRRLTHLLKTEHSR